MTKLTIHKRQKHLSLVYCDFIYVIIVCVVFVNSLAIPTSANIVNFFSCSLTFCEVKLIVTRISFAHIHSL